MKTLNDYVAIYGEQLRKGDIQKAYMGLMKYTLQLKTELSKSLSNEYTFGNVSQGYMDYSYFPLFNEYLRDRKLRFGIVLNHEKLRFELWLMGQNAVVQDRYWEVLKSTKWNEKQVNKPKYSVLELVLVDKPDFTQLNVLTNEIEKETICSIEEIVKYLKNNEIYNK